MKFCHVLGLYQSCSKLVKSCQTQGLKLEVLVFKDDHVLGDLVEYMGVKCGGNWRLLIFALFLVVCFSGFDIVYGDPI